MEEPIESFLALVRAQPRDEGLRPDERQLLADRWHDRARNEQATSAAFREVHRALMLAGAPRSLSQAALTAVDDERRHAQIARCCAEHYGGTPLDPSPEAEARAADFAGCSPRESAVLYVVLTCAINESVAAGYLDACARESRCKLARTANRALLRDEVKHARLGFGFLSWCNASDRSLVGQALPSLVRTALQQWLDTSEYPASLPAGYGCLNHAALRSAVLSAFDALVLPGFELLGIGVNPVRRVLDEGVRGNA